MTVNQWLIRAVTLRGCERRLGTFHPGREMLLSVLLLLLLLLLLLWLLLWLRRLRRLRRAWRATRAPIRLARLRVRACVRRMHIRRGSARLTRGILCACARWSVGEPSSVGKHSRTSVTAAPAGISTLTVVGAGACGQPDLV